MEGQMYEQAGQLHKALQAYQQAEVVYEAVLQQQKHRRCSTMVRLIHRLQQNDLASTILTKHIHTFGLYHPRTRQLVAEKRALQNGSPFKQP